jgi:hypothetical protein
MKTFFCFVAFAVGVAGGWFGRHYWESQHQVATKCPCCSHCACNKTDCKGSCCADKKCCADCGCTDAGCCAAPGCCSKK